MAPLTLPLAIPDGEGAGRGVLPGVALTSNPYLEPVHVIREALVVKLHPERDWRSFSLRYDVQPLEGGPRLDEAYNRREVSCVYGFRDYYCTDVPLVYFYVSFQAFRRLGV